MFYRPAPGMRVSRPDAPTSRPEPAQDRAATIALMTVTVIAAILATNLLLMAYASIDRCRPTIACGFADSKLSLLVGHALMLISLTVGIALCVWRIARERTAWWVALVTLGAIACSAVVGLVAFGFEAGMF